MTRVRATLAACVLALSAGACSGIQSSLDPSGDQARDIDVVWQVMLWTCTAIYVAVIVGLVLALLKARGNQASEPVERRSRSGLVLWVIFIAMVLVGFTATSYSIDRRLLARVAGAQMVRVTAKQWWWQVEYLDPEPSRQFATANELHLPRDRMTRVELVSGDVIHSLWIPNLNGKMDLIPGRTTELALTPRQAGRYRGQCAEFCGLQHANMALDVYVKTEAEFAAWKQRQLATASLPTVQSAQRGAALFQTHACAMCHTVRGTDAGGRSGPDLTHFASRRTLAAGTRPLTRGDLSAWLADPQLHKPGNNMPAVDLEPQQLNDLTDYLMTLR